MGWFQRDKEKQRYYLLPGMGGRSLRRKRKWMWRWSIITGLCTAGIVGFLMYWIGTR